jgi:hypothetical protein
VLELRVAESGGDNETDLSENHGVRHAWEEMMGVSKQTGVKRAF